MYQRALKVLHLGILFAIAGGLTWLISWGLQLLCAATITGQRFDISNKKINLLALATVVAVIIVSAAVMIVMVFGKHCCWQFIFWSAMFAVASWAVTAVFPGTPVATTPAKFGYCIAVLLWGILMWYIFLKEVTDVLSDAEGADDE